MSNYVIHHLAPTGSTTMSNFTAREAREFLVRQGFARTHAAEAVENASHLPGGVVRNVPHRPGTHVVIVTV